MLFLLLLWSDYFSLHTSLLILLLFLSLFRNDHFSYWRFELNYIHYIYTPRKSHTFFLSRASILVSKKLYRALCADEPNVDSFFLFSLDLQIPLFSLLSFLSSLFSYSLSRSAVCFSNFSFDRLFK